MGRTLSADWRRPRAPPRVCPTHTLASADVVYGSGKFGLLRRGTAVETATVLVHALVATGVNAGGHREILGLEVTSSEDGAGWPAFARGLVTRGLSGVVLVTSDAHPGLVAAIAATLPGASWQRCWTHYLRDLLTKVAKTSQPWVATLVRTIFDQPDAAEVAGQFGRVVPALEAKLPAAAGYLAAAEADLLAFTAVPREIWRQVWSSNPPGAAEQGTTPAHRRGGHLPRPRRHHPPGRRGAHGAKRRMGRSPPLHGPRHPGQSQRHRHRKREGDARHRTH